MGDKFRFGNGPAPETIEYLDGRQLATSFDWRDVYGAEHAYAFTVAKATQLNVLNTIHAAVNEAIREGIPLKQFQKDLAPKLKKMGWWGKQKQTDPLTGEAKLVQLGSPRRLKTIYWANTRTAYGAGKWTRVQRTKKHLPYLVYRLGPSENHRPHHVAKEDTVLPIDHPFWQTWFPPNGWGCLCWVRQISETEAQQIGISESPQIPNKSWTNERTGEVLQIPEGIDPGWQTNPGLSRHRTLAKHLAGELENAPQAIRAAAMHDLVHSMPFKKLQKGEFTGDKVFMPAAVAPKAIADHFDSTTRVVFLSADDAAKQIAKRKEVTNLDYITAQTLLDSGTIIKEGAHDFAAQGFVGGVAWRAVFHLTKKRDEIFLKSLRRSNANQMQRNENRGEKLN
jgi:hypothetical protein